MKKPPGPYPERHGVMDAALPIIENATLLKEKANDAFNSHRFHSAVELYSEAIEVLSRDILGCESDRALESQVSHATADRSTDAVPRLNDVSDDHQRQLVVQTEELLKILFSNRSLCRIKLEEYGCAIRDSTLSIALAKEDFPKAHHRRGSALFALGRYKEAISDFKRVVRSAPSDQEARAKLKECERRAREEAFAAAIDSSSDTASSACVTLDMSVMAVDDAYDGPRFSPVNVSDHGKVMVGDGSVTLDFCTRLLEWYRQQKKLPKKLVMQLIVAAYEYFRNCPSLMDICLDADENHAPNGRNTLKWNENGGPDDCPNQSETRIAPALNAESVPVVYKRITVCGDTHGQFYDLLRIFELNGNPSIENPYLFNGDFVDRGSWSVEVIVSLLAFLVYDPRCIHLVRGNHESLSMNKIYGFEGEVRHKYSDLMFHLFEDLFRALPLGYVIEGANAKRALIVHGGLFSKDGVKLKDLRNINRFCEPPTSGLMSELLWSDPQKEPGWGASKRGVGVSFGPDVTKRFLDDNQLQYLVRSHEMKDNGYEVEADGRLITIFSAPNYCDQMGNRGAFIRFDAEMEPQFTTFESAPHPQDVRPMMYASGAGMGLM